MADWRILLVAVLVLAMAWSFSSVYFAYENQLVETYNKDFSRGQVVAIVYNPESPGPATGLVIANVLTG